MGSRPGILLLYRSYRYRFKYSRSPGNDATGHDLGRSALGIYSETIIPQVFGSPRACAPESVKCTSNKIEIN